LKALKPEIGAAALEVNGYSQPSMRGQLIERGDAGPLDLGNPSPTETPLRARLAATITVPEVIAAGLSEKRAAAVWEFWAGLGPDGWGEDDTRA